MYTRRERVSVRTGSVNFVDNVSRVFDKSRTEFEKKNGKEMIRYVHQLFLLSGRNANWKKKNSSDVLGYSIEFIIREHLKDRNDGGKWTL